MADSTTQADQYTIKFISDDNHVIVLFSYDNSEHDLVGFPVHDVDALQVALSQYAVAYREGKELEQAVQPDPQLQALIGKPQEVVIPEPQPEQPTDSADVVSDQPEGTTII